MGKEKNMINPITKGYKIRLYPNQEQEELINKTFGCVRFIYNYFLDYRIRLYQEEGKSISKFALMNLLKPMKRQEEFNWLGDVDSISLQSSLENLDNAYQRFFKLHSGFPKFKSKKDNKQSYTTKSVNNSIKIINNKIQIPKLGLVKFKNGREILGTIKRVTITKSKSGKYFASIVCMDAPHIQQESTGAILGIDLGIKDFLITSEGQKIGNPKFYQNSQKNLVKSQKRLSRKPIGSKNRDKIRIKIARIFEKIENQRNDFLHKLSRSFANNYDLICCEDLNVKGMIRNHNLAKQIQDVSWSKFLAMLEYKLNWEDKKLIKINTFFPSSKTCSVCGHKKEDLTLDVREWICPECNTEHDRDINAARNILNEGLRIFNS